MKRVTVGLLLTITAYSFAATSTPPSPEDLYKEATGDEERGLRKETQKWIDAKSPEALEELLVSLQEYRSFLMDEVNKREPLKDKTTDKQIYREYGLRSELMMWWVGRRLQEAGKEAHLNDAFTHYVQTRLIDMHIELLEEKLGTQKTAQQTSFNDKKPYMTTERAKVF